MALLVVVICAAPVAAQMSESEHASHHPGAAAGAPATPTVPTAPPAFPAPGTAGCCGEGSGNPLLYPTLMNLPRVSPAQRDSLLRLARERRESGITLLGEGLDRYARALRAGDDGAMTGATGEMREGIGRLESGNAALRALGRGVAPNTVALSWLRTQMTLPGESSDVAHGPFGLSWFHVLVMALLVAFAALMIGMYFFKMRRAAALLKRLAAGTPSPAAGANVGATETKATPAIPAAGGSAPASAASPSGTDPPAAPPSNDAGSTGAATSPATLPSAKVAPPPPAAAGAPPPPAATGASPPPAAAGAPPATAATAGPPAAADAPPTTASKPRPSAGGAAPTVWTGTLQIAHISDETPTAKTYRLVPPGGGPLPFTFIPGQFLNIAVTIDKKLVRRAYSIASAPSMHDAVEITVKREPLGLVSRYLNDQSKVGDRFEVTAPLGHFTFTGREAKAIALIAGGGGIMPLMSVIRDLAEREWPGAIDLIYTAHAPSDFIYRHELEQLRQRHSNLHLIAIAERPDGTEWLGLTGRLTTELLAATVPEIASRRIHLCGPPAMMDAVRGMLAELKVPPAQIHTEAFGSAPPTRATGAAPADAKAPSASAPPATPTSPPGTPAEPVAPSVAAPASPAPTLAPAAAAPVSSAPTPATSPAPTAAAPAGPTSATVTFTRANKTAPISASATVLEVSERVGVPIEWSCRVGVCGLCKVHLLSGQVTMAVQDSLTEADKQGGIVLACQAKATAPIAVEA